LVLKQILEKKHIFQKNKKVQSFKLLNKIILKNYTVILFPLLIYKK